MVTKFMIKKLVILFAVSVYFTTLSHAASLVDTIQKIKPAIVGIGVHTPLGQPQNVVQGSGFAVGNGHYVVTNYHVVPKDLDEEKLQVMAVFIGSGKSAKVRLAKVVAEDHLHDLAILKIKGEPLPVMTLANEKYSPEGSYIAFTGFPIGSILGLYPVTHRGIISSITPTIVPVSDSREINLMMLRRYKDPYLAYQLDATAYPGNSGSALYGIESGSVIGIVNKVFVQETKEAIIAHPSGITYAIPVRYLRRLLDKNKIKYNIH